MDVYSRSLRATETRITALVSLASCRYISVPFFETFESNYQVMNVIVVQVFTSRQVQRALPSLCCVLLPRTLFSQPACGRRTRRPSNQQESSTETVSSSTWRKKLWSTRTERTSFRSLERRKVCVTRSNFTHQSWRDLPGNMGAI